MRSHAARLCCDDCDGIMLTVEDLKQSIDELIQIRPELAFVHVKPGAKSCPDCTGELSECRLELHILQHTIKPRVDVGFCTSHGFWFGNGGLAQIYLAVERVLGAHGGNIPERNGRGLKLPPNVKL